jgi:hypothetical protein
VRGLVLLSAVALLACSGELAGHEPSESPSSTPGPIEPSPDRTARTLFVRTCESSVFGDLGADWRRGQIAAGPLVFVGAAGYADDPGDRFAAPGRLATSQKVLIVVRGARPVEVSVRHPGAALAYDPARWGDRNVVPFGGGDPRVRFEPCGGDRRWTQFNGAFLLRGPGCVPVEVRPADRGPTVVTISFGAGDRC